MKAEIWRNGVLAVKPENSTEAYALAKWCEENKGIFDEFPISVETVE